MLRNRMLFDSARSLDGLEEFRAKYSDTIKERVQKGARFLDKEIPDWFEHVDPATLWMPSYDYWMVAQVTGSDYGTGTDELGLHDTNLTIEHGFHYDHLSHPGHFYYLVTQDHWLAEIEARLNKPSARKYRLTEVNQEEEVVW